jgi:hypothetical protein
VQLLTAELPWDDAGAGAGPGRGQGGAEGGPGEPCPLITVQPSTKNYFLPGALNKCKLNNTRIARQAKTRFLPSVSLCVCVCTVQVRYTLKYKFTPCI